MRRGARQRWGLGRWRRWPRCRSARRRSRRPATSGSLRRGQHRVDADRPLHGRNARPGVREPAAQPRQRHAADRRELAGPGAVRRGGRRHRPGDHPAGPAAIRATLDPATRQGQPDWVTVLGTALAPATTAFPWRSLEHARRSSATAWRPSSATPRAAGRGHRARQRAGPDVPRRPRALPERLPWPTRVPSDVNAMAARSSPRRARTSGPGRASATARSTRACSGTGPRSSTASCRWSRTRGRARAVRDRPLLPPGAHLRE